DERNILLAIQGAQEQEQHLINPSSPMTASAGNNLNNISTNNNNNNNNESSSDQRSQIISSSINRFPLLGAFKRQLSDTSSEDSDSEPDVFYSTRISGDDDDEDDDSDKETTFYPIYNNNNNINNKSCCFEMNGCDLLDGGKRRRH
ncbi:unnamed protein product, partial [Rotaria magnacalcarata]